MGVYLVHHLLHNFSPELGVGIYMVMGAYKVLYSTLQKEGNSVEFASLGKC